MSFNRSATLLAVAVVAVFGRAVGFDFLWDDFLFLVDNERIKNLANIPAFFSEPTADLYRPLRTVLYSVTYSVFGLNPAPYHAMGLLFHITASVLVLRIMGLCGFSASSAFIGSLIFALHPVHIEKIIFVTSVFDMPGDLFMLAAVYFYLMHRAGTMSRGMLASLTFFAVGLLFTETVAAFPFLCLLLEVTVVSVPGLNRKQRLIFAAGCALILVAYLIVRTEVVGRVARQPDEIEYLPLQLTMMAVYLHYWRLMVIPYPLLPVAPFETMNTLYCGFCLTALLMNAFLLMAAWRVKQCAPLVTAGVFWFYLALLPNSNIIPTGTLMAERYLYLPSIGFSFVAATLFSIGTGYRKQVAIFFIAVFALLSFYQTGNWKNGETLWKWTLKQKPDSGYAYHNLGAFYHREKRGGDAVELYREMADKGIKKYEALSELASYAIDNGDYADAEKLLTELARVKPDDFDLAGNLLIARCQQNRPGWREEAAQFLRNHPSTFLYEQIGICHAKIGEKARAMDVFRKALEIDPDNESVKSKITLLQR